MLDALLGWLVAAFLIGGCILICIHDYRLDRRQKKLNK
jgi:hypothetical protein